MDDALTVLARFEPLLLVALGLVLGLWLVGLRKVHRGDRPVARLVGLFLEPLFYWADLRGPDGRPSHTKVVYFAVMMAMLGVFVLLAQAEAQQPEDVRWGFLAYTLLTASFGLGKRVFERVVDLFGGGRLQELLERRRASGAAIRPSTAEQADPGRPLEGSL